MLCIQDVFNIQSEHEVGADGFAEKVLDMNDYLENCRKYISDNLPKEYSDGSWDADKKDKELDNVIAHFVHNHLLMVSGYVSDAGVIDKQRLLNDVTENIKGEGILKDALEDPDVDEIQINDYKTIFVVRKGMAVPYQDKYNKYPQFASNAEVLIMINKLVNDGNMPQFNDGAPLLNAKTAKKQYRISATHSTACARGLVPWDFPITSVVIRKFKESKLTIDNMVEYKSITTQIGQLMQLMGRVHLNIFFVGGTGSGKTTLLTATAQTIPMSDRIALVQNPTEITFFDRDEDGRNRRNVVHWEANDSADQTKKNTNTMSNLVGQALRNTPDVLILGEARAPDEFEQLQRAMKTGHRVMGTYHADNPLDAIYRGASELCTAMHISIFDAVRLWSQSVNVIISQYRFPDGSRRVLDITEVLGVDKEGEPQFNTIYHYNMTHAFIDEKGIPHTVGEYVYQHPLSDGFQQKLRKSGVPDELFRPFTLTTDEYNTKFGGGTDAKLKICNS